MQSGFSLLLSRKDFILIDKWMNDLIVAETKALLISGLK